MVYVRRRRQSGFANIWNIAVVKYRPPSWWYYCRSYPSDADLKGNESIVHTVQDDSPSTRRTWSFVLAWVGLSNFVSRLVQVAAWDLGDSRSDGLSLNMSNLDPATIFPILTYPYQIRIELINEEEFPSSSDYLKYSPESTSSWLLTPTVILPNFYWTESATNGSSNFNMATLSRELYASMCIITLRYIILHVYVFDESDARSAHDSVVQSYSAHVMEWARCP